MTVQRFECYGDREYEMYLDENGGYVYYSRYKRLEDAAKTAETAREKHYGEFARHE